MSPLARKILSVIIERGGSAPRADLEAGFDVGEVTVRRSLRELLWEGVIWQVNGRFTTTPPRLHRARVFLARGASLATAADVAGMTARELDLALWRDMCRRANAPEWRRAA